MVLFLILLPFAVFTGLMMLTTSAVSLLVAAAVAAMIVARDVLTGRSVKLLGTGSAMMFLAVGVYVALVDPQMSAYGVRIAVDLGTLAIAIVSMAIGQPFTLQYGREIVDADTAQRPNFRRANYVLTLAWTAAFALMLGANILMVYAPSVPFWVGLLIAFAARGSATYFTRWYPQRLRAKLVPLTT